MRTCLLILACIFFITITTMAEATPSVIGTCGTTDVTSSGGSATLNLPASIQSGEWLIAYAGTDTGLSSATWPAGWTELTDNDVGGTSMSTAYRHADGTEGATIILTVAGSNDHVLSVICRVTDGHASTVPEAVTGATGTSINPDCSSLNPTNWDVESTLWFCGFSLGSSQAVDTPPSSYSLAGEIEGGSAIAATHVYTRANSIAAEDPGAATLAASTSWVAVTIGVRPAAATNKAGPLINSTPLKSLVGGGLVQ